LSESDNSRYEDGENYQFGYDKELTFRGIILEHMKRISQFASVEWRGGHYEEKILNSGGSISSIRIYIPDSREVYINAVKCLADMLAPYFDDEMKQAEENVIKDFKEYKKNVKLKLSSNNKDDIIRKYTNYKIEVYQKLFRSLCCFLYRKKYLDIGSLGD